MNYATANATATQPADYTTTSGTLTFTPGQVTKTVSVPVVGDIIDEIDETFVVNLTVPVNVTIADNQGVGTITDDDPLPSITINDVALTEGELRHVEHDVHRDPVGVERQDRHRRLRHGRRHGHVPGRLHERRPGPSRSLRALSPGPSPCPSWETPWTSSTRRSSPTSRTRRTPRSPTTRAIGTITDNDPIPTLTFANVTVIEPDVGTVTATFTVTLSAASGKTVTVDYATANGTATSPADYSATSGTFTFNPGQTTKTIDIAVQGDLLNEANETYTVTLTNPTNATIPVATRTGTITDNDPLPSVVINDVSLTEGNVGTTNADFTVTLSAPSGRNRHGELRHGQRHRHPTRRLHDDLGHAHVHPGPGDEDGVGPGRRRHDR